MIDAAIEGARFVLVNPDLLIPQISGDARGVVTTRANLPGWASKLKSISWDVAIVDEIHRVRGWQSKNPHDDSNSKREMICNMIKSVPAVWGLTGTPCCGFTRDYWGQVDMISRGVWSYRDLPFRFHTYFCDGHKGEYGWQCDGTSEAARTELPERLKIFMLGRPRSVAIPFMPPKTREVRHVESDESPEIPMTGDRASRVTKMLKSSLRIKMPVLVEETIDELANGGSVVIFTQRKGSATDLTKAIDKAMQARTNRRRLEMVDAKLWSVVGDDPDARSAAMEKFVAHAASHAACFVSTIAACQVGSLRGATTVHYAEIEHDPAMMLQSEDRGFEPGITHGLSIVYWVVPKSYDDHAVKLLLPKIELLDKLTSQSDAGQLATALRGPLAPAKTLDEIWDSLCADMPADFDVED